MGGKASTERVRFVHNLTELAFCDVIRESNSENDQKLPF